MKETKMPDQINTETSQENQVSDNGIKPLELDSGDKKTWLYVGIGCLIVVLGVVSGFGLTQLTAKSGGISSENVQPVSETGEVDNIEVGKTYGRQDEIFSSEAEGVIKQGGLDGEGTHHLEREGGESQTAYLTSSVVDLDQFVDRKVKVFGETFAGQKAGWLMDVGAVKVLE
jgi:hypothetical protein